jgi:hypothetical protein
MARFCAGILPWQKADLADPHFSEFVLWRRKRTSKVRLRMRTSNVKPRMRTSKVRQRMAR